MPFHVIKLINILRTDRCIKIISNHSTQPSYKRIVIESVHYTLWRIFLGPCIRFQLATKKVIQSFTGMQGYHQCVTWTSQSVNLVVKSQLMLKLNSDYRSTCTGHASKFYVSFEILLSLCFV